jgi:hypothetical protein
MAGKRTLPVVQAITSEKVEVVAASYDVTDAGVRLLNVFADPTNRTMTAKARADMAGISRETYYHLFKDERFKAAYNELFFSTVFQAAIPIAQKQVEVALGGDTTAAKMILEMSGHHQKTERVEHTHTFEAGKSLLDMYKSRQRPILE